MEGKTIFNNHFFRDLFLAILPTVMLAIIGLGGCWSPQEKVHKLFVVVAEVVEGDYHVETFLIDGEPPIEGMTRMPGERVTATVYQMLGHMPFRDGRLFIFYDLWGSRREVFANVFSKGCRTFAVTKI